MTRVSGQVRHVNAWTPWEGRRSLTVCDNGQNKRKVRYCCSQLMPPTEDHILTQIIHTTAVNTNAAIYQTICIYVN